MHYVSVEGLSKTFGIKPLFKGISFHIEEGDKIALVARNGSGKSTLLKILSGLEKQEEGTVWIHKEVKVAFLDQHPVFDENKNLIENIFDHDHPVLNLIKRYEAMTEGDQEVDVQELTNLMEKMDELGAWTFDAKVKQILGKLQIQHLS
ncbi:MAG: ATP-binding cassette domain-containing protein, partial [Chitinophagaceae bacterium]